MHDNDAQPINELPGALVAFDNQLYNLVHKIDILGAVAPTNYIEQRTQFFERRFSQEPKFTYRENNIDAFTLKRSLFNLPLQDVQDDDLKQLYTEVIDSYIDKIDQFKSIGTPEFIYDSLRYYGEPSAKDMSNAQFVLHLPKSNKQSGVKLLDATQIGAMLGAFADEHGYSHQMKIDDTMIANALVSGTKIKINSAARINEIEAKALAHHEVGVHLATTHNARNQPLKILRLGCPLNTMTQEGLAILSEYLAGYMTIERLRILALRVVAVESMLRERRFRYTFELLHEQYKVPSEQAFTITARVFRGGGFTKDYLYLKGFHKILNIYENSEDIATLLAGKTAIKYLPLLNRLIEKGFLKPAKFISPAMKKPSRMNEVMQFVAHTIK